MMILMSSSRLPALVALCCAFSLLCNGMTSSEAVDKITKADSLYASKRYSQALDLYEQIFQAGYASPAALLRSAYIQEGTGDIPSALMNLYRYHRLTDDASAYFKITEMAETRNLDGYETTEAERILNLLAGWSVTIRLALMALTVLMLLRIWKYRHALSGAQRWVSGFVLLAALSLTFLFNNHIKPTRKAMAGSSGAQLMSGPSAAADRYDFASPGDMLTIHATTDIWTEVQFRGRRAYARRHQLMPL